MLWRDVHGFGRVGGALRLPPSIPIRCMRGVETMVYLNENPKLERSFTTVEVTFRADAHHCL